MSTTWLQKGRFLGRYLAPRRGEAALAAAPLLVGVGLQMVGPRLIRTFVDAVSAGAPGTLLSRVALTFIGVSLVTNGLKVLASYWGERVAWSASNELRSDLALHLLQLGPAFQKRHPPGELVERIDGDAAALAGAFTSFTVRLLGSILLLVGVVGSMFWESPLLGAGFALFTAAAAVLLGWAHRFAAPAIQRSREESAQFYGYLGEAIQASEDIRASGAVPFAIARFDALVRRRLPLEMRATLFGNLVWVTSLAVFALADALAYGLGGWFYLQGKASIGTVYMVTAYAALIAQPLEAIREEMQNLQQAEAAMDRVLALLSLAPPLAGGALPLPPGPLAVAVQSVDFNYEADEGTPSQGVQGIAGVSLKLQPGRHLGVIGRTGSGKTTLARLLARLYDPQQGAVRLGDIDLRQADLRSLRNRVAVVTQNVQVLQGTVRDNLTLFRAGITDARVVGTLENLGLGPWLCRLPQELDTRVSPVTLSSGEAQLLAAARVLLTDPGLVVLDEVSSQLDGATESLLGEALHRLLAGRTAVIIAHRLATLDHVDDILILDEGRVVEYGPRTVLAADPHSWFARLRQAGLHEVLL